MSAQELRRCRFGPLTGHILGVLIQVADLMYLVRVVDQYIFTGFGCINGWKMPVAKCCSFPIPLGAMWKCADPTAN